jgi:hypothetical protein
LGITDSGGACGGGGGGGTLTVGTTATSGFTAGKLLYSDGSLLQAAGAIYDGSSSTLQSPAFVPSGMTNPGVWVKIYNPNSEAGIAIKSYAQDVASFNGQMSAVELPGGIELGWMSASSFGLGTTPDTGLSRISAGVLAVGSGTVGDVSGTIKLAALLPGVIYSAAGTALPSCVSGLKGQQATVSDATAPTYHGAYTSGGAVVSPVYCTGSSWLTF